MNLRLFVAVDLPDDVRAACGEAVERLRADLRRGGIDDAFRWVAVGNLHLTLRFLGNVDGDSAARVIESMRAPIARDSATIELGGPGTFPPRGRPRVLHVGVASGLEFLRELRADVDARLAPLCRWDADTRPFAPHLTLARGKERGKFNPVDFSRLLERAAWPRAAFRVSRVTLFSSKTLSSGPEYTIQAQAALRSSG